MRLGENTGEVGWLPRGYDANRRARTALERLCQNRHGKINRLAGTSLRPVENPAPLQMLFREQAHSTATAEGKDLDLRERRRPNGGEFRLAASRTLAYLLPMTYTRRIPAQCFHDLGVREGDTLKVIALHGDSLIVQVNRDEDGTSDRKGKASEWLRSAKGSVRPTGGESADDLRMEYYAAKYGVAK